MKNTKQYLDNRFSWFYYLARLKWAFFPTSRTKATFTHWPVFSKFLKVNLNVWEKFFEGIEVNKTGRPYVLIAQKNNINSDWVLSKNIVGAHLVKYFNVSPLVLLHTFYHDQTVSTCQSYRFGKFISFYEENFNISSRIKAFFHAFILVRKVKTPQSLLNLHLSGVKIGDLIYDTYLNDTAECTIEAVNFSLFSLFKDILFKYYRYKSILNKHDIKYLVLEMEDRACNEGILLRMALQRGIKCYMVTSVLDKLALTVYNSLNDLKVKTMPLKPSTDLVELFYNNPKLKTFAIERTDKRLDEIFNSKEVKKDVHVAHDPGRFEISKEEFVKKIGIDKSKPVVVIMSHIFMDVPHGLGDLLFNDYLHWYREVISRILSIKEVNWIIKPHPTANVNYKRSKQSASTEFYKLVPKDCKHIFLVEDTYRMKSFIKIADAFVSCMGSIGVEGPCLGIPALISYDGPFGGFGFAIEGNTAKNYLDRLSELVKIVPLTSEQIERAKVVYYLSHVNFMQKIELIPFVERHERNLDIFWEKATETHKKIECLKQLKIFKNLEAFFKDKNDVHMLDYFDMEPKKTENTISN